MNKKLHTCPYCGSQVKPMTNSDILKIVGKASNLTFKKIRDDRNNKPKTINEN